MAEKLVTLITYTYNTEAYILIAKLEAEGIPHVLKNEHLLATQQFLSNAVGGLDVQVEEKDLEKALVVLKELEQNNSSSAQLPSGISSDFEKVLIYCPECESSEVFRKKASFFSFGAKEHVCANCKHTWKQ
jgi:hypothetical protein